MVQELVIKKPGVKKSPTWIIYLILSDLRDSSQVQNIQTKMIMTQNVRYAVPGSVILENMYQNVVMYSI